MHLSAQLDLLKRRLESCQDKIDDGRSEDLIEVDYTIEDPKIECVCRTMLEEIVLDPIIELHTCIQHHQHVLRSACNRFSFGVFFWKTF